MHERSAVQPAGVGIPLLEEVGSAWFPSSKGDPRNWGETGWGRGIPFLSPRYSPVGVQDQGNPPPSSQSIRVGRVPEPLQYTPSLLGGRPAWPIIGSIHACNEMEMRAPDRGSIEQGRMTASFRAWRGSPPLSPACSFTAPLCPPSPDAPLCPPVPFTLAPGLLPS